MIIPRNLSGGTHSASRRKGFTIIELLIVIAIIGIIMSVAGVNVFGRSALAQRKAFVASLNKLLATGWDAAIKSRTIHIVRFDAKERFVRLESVVSFDSQGKPKTKPVTGQYADAVMDIPEQFEIKNFVINGTDAVAEWHGNLKDVYFYIMPDGMSQEVTINMLDTSGVQDNKPPHPMGLVLNPFSVQFDVYDALQK